MVVKHNHRLDMIPGGVPTVVHVNQYDDNFDIEFTLYWSGGHGFNYNLNCDAEIRGTKLDGNGYTAECDYSHSSAKCMVTVHGDKQMTAIAGKNIYEIALLYDGQIVHSSNFILDVERAALDAETVVSRSIINQIDEFLIDHPEYFNEAVDDVVIVDHDQPESERNKLWIKNDEIEEIEIPTMDDFSELSEHVDDISDPLRQPELDNTMVMSGVYIDGIVKYTSGSNNKTLFVPCVANATYTIKKASSPTFKIGWVQYNTLGVLVGDYQSLGTETVGTVETGSNAAYIVVDYYENDTSYSASDIFDSIVITTDYYKAEDVVARNLINTEIDYVDDVFDQIFEDLETKIDGTWGKYAERQAINTTSFSYIPLADGFISLVHRPSDNTKIPYVVVTDTVLGHVVAASYGVIGSTNRESVFIPVKAGTEYTLTQQESEYSMQLFYYRLF